jgi:hypothetical protein
MAKLLSKFTVATVWELGLIGISSAQAASLHFSLSFFDLTK